jgi:hypothetical protein
MFIFILVAILSANLFSNVIEAPYIGVDFDQNPSSINWKVIDSEHFEIIFPEGTETQAQRVTNLLEASYPIVSHSLEVLPPKISIILQNQSTVSNGFVTLAPRRSEWYLTPAIDPELTNTEWLKTLAIHEFRHVVQFQKSRRGFNRGFEIILGEIGQALGIGLSYPAWFLEGDAVGIETALTEGGRGRLPMFERDLKALLLSGYKFNYDKAHLGSYRDYIPNHYIYGYFYTTFMRNHFGDLFLSRLANQAPEWSINPLYFYRAYSNLTDEDFEEFYRRTMKELITAWKEKEKELPLTAYKVQNYKDKKSWTNYHYPQAIDNKRILALKRGLSHISQFVILDGVKEETLIYPGVLQNEYPYRLRSGRFAYIEWELDSRWGYRDFTRIKVFDLNKRNFVADIRKTKGRLAVLNKSGDKLLYVNWDAAQGQQIVVSKLDGKIISTKSFSSERVITSLDWLSDEEIVMVVKDHQDKKSIIQLSLKSGEEATLIGNTNTNFGYLSVDQGKVLVEGPRSGIDNIFLVENNSLTQLTSSRFGAYSPSLYGDKLIYNDYSADGMNVVIKDASWNEELLTQDSFIPFYEKFAAFEKKAELEEAFFKQEKYPVKDYKQLKNSLNFHSWVILAPPLSSNITLMATSKDLLNKFTLFVGGNYDLNERELEGFVSAAWTHYYPVYDIRAAYRGRNQRVLVNNEVIRDQWEEGTFEAGLSIPWRGIHGRFMQNFTARAFSKIIKVTNKLSNNLTEINDGALHSPGIDLFYSFMSRRARRDINAPWGFQLNAHLEQGKDITGNDQEGSIVSADSRYFIPGIFEHHSFFHQFAYEKQRDRFYQYPSMVLKVRGTRNFYMDEFTKYSANYLLPLYNADWNLSRYLYFKRFVLNTFYDELNGRSRGSEFHLASTGWELLMETHFLRIFIPVTLGLRRNYILHGEEQNSYEIFLSTLVGTF